MALNQANARQRLRHLLAIPESDRTDIQWNEIHFLELEVVRPPDPTEPGKPQLRKPANGNRPSGTTRVATETPAPDQSPERVKKKPLSSYLRSRKRNKRPRRT